MGGIGRVEAVRTAIEAIEVTQKTDGCGLDQCGRANRICLLTRWEWGKELMTKSYVKA